MDARQRMELDALNLAIKAAGGVPCAGDDLMISGSEEDQAEGAHWCARCPVLDTCRAYGLTWPREEGVFGGMTQPQRQKRPKRAPKPEPTPEELDRRKELSRERSRRARALRKQRQNGEIAC